MTERDCPDCQAITLSKRVCPECDTPTEEGAEQNTGKLGWACHSCNTIWDGGEAYGFACLEHGGHELNEPDQAVPSLQFGHDNSNEPDLSWGQAAKALEKVKSGPLLPWREMAKTCAIFDVRELYRATPPITKDNPFPNLELAYSCPLPFPQVAFLFPKFVILVKDATIEGDTHTLKILGIQGYPKNMFAVGGGTVVLHPLGDEVNARMLTEELGFFVLQRGWTSADVNSDQRADMVADALAGYTDSVMMAFTWLNAPYRFMVEHGPVNPKKAKPKSIPRLYQRPSYILVNKSEIVRRYHAAQSPGRKSPMPHLRRGHYRTLTSSVHKEPGKRVWVRPTHVKGNTVEWREGDRFYKVI